MKFLQNLLKNIGVAQIYDPNTLSVKHVNEYSMFKLRANLALDFEIPAGSEILGFHLARDFFKELKEPFIAKQIVQAIREFCKYFCLRAF